MIKHTVQLPLVTFRRCAEKGREKSACGVAAEHIVCLIHEDDALCMFHLTVADLNCRKTEFIAAVRSAASFREAGLGNGIAFHGELFCKSFCETGFSGSGRAVEQNIGRFSAQEQLTQNFAVFRNVSAEEIPGQRFVSHLLVKMTGKRCI